MKSVNQPQWSLYTVSKVEQIKSSFPFINMFIIQKRRLIFLKAFKKYLKNKTLPQLKSSIFISREKRFQN